MTNDKDSVYLWKVSEYYPTNFIGEYCKENTQDRFLYRQGVRINNNITQPTVIFTEATKKQLKEYSCLASSMMIPLINHNISNIIINNTPNNIQLMDVIIQTIDGQLGGYKILNITQVCDGIDETETKYNYIPGTKHIFGFEKFKYKRGCLKNIQIARTKNYHGHLIVSAKLKNKLQKIKNLGVFFEKVS